MPSFAIHTGYHQGRAGISLRGSCLDPADANCLEQGLALLLTTARTQIWLDCQQLESLSPLGQRVWLWADNQARAAGVTLYWCGLRPAVLEQLRESGLALLLKMGPATAYQGPAELLRNPEALLALPAPGY
ncbi:STAS domain-containing protein [Hymenobacter sp. NST-14]|uniref:STAS domain-containing protein n=1 Tax=Hymenobacter piscis TaxID=2839984 RepID=UPI001C00B0D6|nr:STAS domain-containing protein [Hymenobacter piscis]MBT9394157.1 STAS domain-containing protein [Hymenobacter piscis]